MTMIDQIVAKKEVVVCAGLWVVADGAMGGAAEVGEHV